MQEPDITTLDTFVEHLVEFSELLDLESAVLTGTDVAAMSHINENKIRVLGELHHISPELLDTISNADENNLELARARDILAQCKAMNQRNGYMAQQASNMCHGAISTLQSFVYSGSSAIYDSFGDSAGFDQKRQLGSA